MRRARRYILRVRPDGTLRITIPRGGSRAEAASFMQKHIAWVARERSRVRKTHTPVEWTDGTTILLDGEPVVIAVERGPVGLVARFGSRSVSVTNSGNLRPDLEANLRTLARERLVPRLYELASALGVTVNGASIRNQSSRWGSCSRKGFIALNFRLVQMPPAVAEYVLIHELMHLKQQNHGPRFWRLVAHACPSFRESERWLRKYGRSLF